MIEIVEHTTKTLTKEINTNIRQNRVLGKNIIRKRKVLFNDKRNKFIRILYLYPSNNIHSGCRQ